MRAESLVSGVSIPLRFLMVLMGHMLILGCEDVIEVEVPTEEPRLIVDAFTRIDVTEEIIPFKVKVTTSSNFFEETPVTSLERIVILVEETDEDGFVTTSDKILTELEPGSGIYFPDPCCDGRYITYTDVLDRDVVFRLIIEHKSRRYFAETRYVPAVPIDTIFQGDNTLFDDDETEIVVGIADDPDRDNFYIFDFDFDEYLVTEDEFYKGQEFQFSYFYDRKFEPGTEIDISILGADQSLYTYMDQLIEQTEDQQGPFQTPVSTIRGNVFDITGIDNRDLFDNAERPQVFPLGYFAIVQEIKKTITIE